MPRSRQTQTSPAHVIRPQDSCSSDIKENMTVGSIIVFLNGDRKNSQQMRKLSPPYFAVFTEPWQKKRIQLAMLKKSCREFFFFFFFSRVGAQQPPLCNPRVNYGSNGSSGKKREIKINFLETQLKKVRIIFLCYSSTTTLRQCREQHSFNLFRLLNYS